MENSRRPSGRLRKRTGTDSRCSKWRARVARRTLAPSTEEPQTQVAVERQIPSAHSITLKTARKNFLPQCQTLPPHPKNGVTNFASYAQHRPPTGLLVHQCTAAGSDSGPFWSTVAPPVASQRHACAQQRRSRPDYSNGSSRCQRDSIRKCC